VSVLRIIAGSRKGHRIRVPKGVVVRPTSERVREALFAALGPLEGERVLDLFAGTGALGLEALSRGASNATFVEKDRAVASVLARNLASLSLTSQARVHVLDYERALRIFLHEERAFDLLFVDPPYRILPDVARTLTPVIQRLLTPSGLTVLEGPRRTTFDLGLDTVFERRYGDTTITMLQARKEGQ
jgi:16S rRNA (guanine(966)-N(2))-methyltransferase RsmD